MKKYTFFCIFCVTFVFPAVFVHSQGFTGAGFGYGYGPNNAPDRPVTASRPITVSEARDLPHNSWVVLTGNIVNALPRDRYYTFRDGSGEIVIEIDWRVWRGLSFNASDTVEICGEVLRINRRQVIIRVNAVTSIDGANTGLAGAVTVDEARNLARDSWVVLTGNILNALSGQRGRFYTFQDSSGEIIIEIDMRVWRGLSAGTSDRVEISGEVIIIRGQALINVKAIRKL